MADHPLRVLLVSPGKAPEPITLDGTLAAMQATVGGLIQAVYPFEEPVALVCNDEGKLLGLPPNRALRHPETGAIYDIVCGDFFLCAAPPDSDSFQSLSPQQLETYTARFQHPEFLPGAVLFREVL